MLTPTRIESEELLDAGEVTAEDRERSLRDLRRINRFLGGVGVYRKLIRTFDPRSILDLGTGTSDLLDAVPAVALRIGLDFNIEHLLYLREGSRVHRVVGDAHHLPFRNGTVDLVTSSHFFHHFSPEENVSILTDSLRVARKGVAFTDTRRHYLPLLAMLLVSALRLVGRVTRFDAPASVRQGYTLAEVRTLAPRARASRWTVLRKWPFRFALLLWKEREIGP